MASPSRPEVIIAASTQVLDGVLEELATLGWRISSEEIAVACDRALHFPPRCV